MIESGFSIPTRLMESAVGAHWPMPRRPAISSCRGGARGTARSTSCWQEPVASPSRRAAPRSAGRERNAGSGTRALSAGRMPRRTSTPSCARSFRRRDQVLPPGGRRRLSHARTGSSQPSDRATWQRSRCGRPGVPHAIGCGTPGRGNLVAIRRPGPPRPSRGTPGSPCRRTSPSAHGRHASPCRRR